jgi:NhaP-type Na+/H+ or K+/H+ antiporter
MEFLKIISIRLVGGIGLGLIAGLLEIIILPYLYDDPINEITITIAVPYILYWLCKYNE